MIELMTRVLLSDNKDPVQTAHWLLWKDIFKEHAYNQTWTGLMEWGEIKEENESFMKMFHLS